MKIKHAYVSPKIDVPTAGLVKPGHWNADHKIEDIPAGIVLGRKTGGSGLGEIEELPIKVSLVSVLLDAFTGIFRIPRGTSAQRPVPPDLMGGDIRFNVTTGRVEFWDGVSWVNLAVGDNQFTGALSWAITDVEPTGWIFFYGSIGRGGTTASHANDNVRNLWNVMWALDPLIFEMGDGVRGASAQVDWDAFRVIKIPDWRERGFAISGNMMASAPNNVLGNGAGGGFETAATLFKTGGQKAHVLVKEELAKHEHPSGMQIAANAGTTSTPGSNFVVAHPHTAPATELVVENQTAGDLPHNVTQPTVMLNCFVKL